MRSGAPSGSGRLRIGFGSPISRFRAVWNRDYGKLWGIGISTNVMRWLETVALGVFVYDLTDSAFLVGFVGFLRMAPMLFLGAIIGIISDRANRRLMLALTNLTLSLVYVVLAVLIISGRIELWHVSVGAFVAGAVWATDFPVRRAMVAETVARDRIASAFGVDMASSNLSRVAGPVVGGAFLQEIGMEAVYLLGAVLFFFASMLAFTVQTKSQRVTGVSDAGATGLRRVRDDLLDGVRVVRGDMVLMVTLIVTVIMNLFAFPYQHMIPVIGAEKLNVAPVYVGLLLSVEGLGATIGALSIAALSRPRHFTRVYTYASLGFLVTIVGFALAPWFWLALPLLFVGGFGMSGFGTMQSIIVVSSTRSEIRGRVLGVLAVAIGSGPLGALHVGWLASNIGADLAVVSIAIVGFALTMVTVLVWRRFLVSIPRYHH